MWCGLAINLKILLLRVYRDWSPSHVMWCHTLLQVFWPYWLAPQKGVRDITWRGLAINSCLAWPIKNHISAPKQNFQNPLVNFLCINIRSQYAKFLLSCLKIEGEVLRWWTVLCEGSAFYNVQKMHVYLILIIMMRNLIILNFFIIHNTANVVIFSCKNREKAHLGIKGFTKSGIKPWTPKFSTSWATMTPF